MMEGWKREREKGRGERAREREKGGRGKRENTRKHRSAVSGNRNKEGIEEGGRGERGGGKRIGGDERSYFLKEIKVNRVIYLLVFYLFHCFTNV